jgi:hypothetical protein
MRAIGVHGFLFFAGFYRRFLGRAGKGRSLERDYSAFPPRWQSLEGVARAPNANQYRAYGGRARLEALDTL